MKKTITLILLMSTVVFASAQILPNPSFEEWMPFSGYENPQYWDTPNSYTSLAGVVVVSKSTDAHSGNYSARLESKNVFGPSNSPGLLTLADFVVDITTGSASFIGGIAVSNKVNKLTGWYKYSGVNNDSANVFMVSYNHNGDNFDTIGIGTAYLHDAADWTQFSIDMIPLSASVADSFNVIIRSSASDETEVGSTLFVDDLSLETITGIINLFEETTTVKVFPNPVSDVVNFEMENEADNLKLSVFDNTGRLVNQSFFSGKTTEINISGMPSGIYSYQIVNENKLLSSGSFVKK